MSGPRIAVIDCGVGNLRSIASALRRVGAEPSFVRKSEEATNFDGIILPGVGAFRSAFESIDPQPLLKGINGGIPVLGICLGLQMLFSSSEEGGGTIKGLEVMKGTVRRIRLAPKLPHIGWNTISIAKESPLLEGIANGSFFYFVHSYACLDVDADYCSAVTDYGQKFVSVATRGSVFGTQFHPEKSGIMGLKVLLNFTEVAR
jgi:glutamine amidotransferase